MKKNYNKHMRSKTVFLTMIVCVVLLSALTVTYVMHIISFPDKKPKPHDVNDSLNGITKDIRVISEENAPTPQTVMQKKFEEMSRVDEQRNSIDVITEEYLEEYWCGDPVKSLTTEEILYIIQDSIRIYEQYNTIILSPATVHPDAKKYAYTDFTKKRTITNYLEFYRSKRVLSSVYLSPEKIKTVEEYERYRRDIANIILYRITVLSSAKAFIMDREVAAANYDITHLDYISMPYWGSAYLPGYSERTDRDLIINYFAGVESSEEKIDHAFDTDILLFTFYSIPEIWPDGIKDLPEINELQLISASFTGRDKESSFYTFRNLTAVYPTGEMNSTKELIMRNDPYPSEPAVTQYGFGEELAGAKDYETNEYCLFFTEQEYSDWLNGKSVKTVQGHDSPEDLLPVYDIASAEAVRKIAVEKDFQLLFLYGIKRDFKKSGYLTTGREIFIDFKDRDTGPSIFDIYVNINDQNGNNLKYHQLFFDKKYDPAIAEGIPALISKMEQENESLYFSVSTDAECIAEKTEVFDRNAQTYVETDAYIYFTKNDKRNNTGHCLFVYKGSVISLDFDLSRKDKILNSLGFESADYKQYDSLRTLWWK